LPQQSYVPQPTFTLLPTYTPFPTFTPNRIVVTQTPIRVTTTPISQAGTPLEEMPIIEGTWAYKPDTVIRGEKYPKALYFAQERIVVRVLQKYRTLVTAQA
jgi:hypothetical protein